MVNLGSVLSNYKFLCNSFSPGMEATNVPGTAKVLGLNLTGRAFFCKREMVSKIICRLIIVCCCFVGLVAIL